MLRGASAEALADLSEELGSTRTLADAATLGEELFGVARVLRDEPALRRVATDACGRGRGQGRSRRERVRLGARRPALGRGAQEAVQRRWTVSRDLADVLEHLGVLALVQLGGQGRRPGRATSCSPCVSWSTRARSCAPRCPTRPGRSRTARPPRAAAGRPDAPGHEQAGGAGGVRRGHHRRRVAAWLPGHRGRRPRRDGGHRAHRAAAEQGRRAAARRRPRQAVRHHGPPPRRGRAGPRRRAAGRDRRRRHRRQRRQPPGRRPTQGRRASRHPDN